MGVTRAISTIFNYWPVRYLTRIVALVLTIIGLAGIPDDVETWSRWIDKVVNDPQVLMLAQKAVAVAEFVNQQWVRLALGFGGIVILLWPMRWFWKVRHKIFSWGKRAMDQIVWISESDAVDAVKNSAWAKSRYARKAKVVSFSESVTQFMGRFDPAERDRQNRFIEWCRMVARQIALERPNSVRDINGEMEYDEEALHRWLAERYQTDLIDEFGEP